MKKKAEKQIVIVTGLSGAGMSTALKSLEDMGFEIFDNIPVHMVSQVIEEPSVRDKLAFGIDTRTRGFSVQGIEHLLKLYDAQLVFLTCDKAVLQRRFNETRRRHPMARGGLVRKGIDVERDMLKPLDEAINLLIDTSVLSIHDLRHILDGHFGQSKEAGLNITLMSFGFKHGAPREADIIMDVRFLKNPHWDKKLKPQTGKDKAVGKYIEEDEGFAPFISSFGDLIKGLLPRYDEEGKSYLTVAIGCTGGRHRSVYCVERLVKMLKGGDYPIHIEHRDIDK